MKKKLLIILLIVVMLELTLFNINSYRVLSSNSKLEYAKDDFKNVYTDEEDEIYIEIDNINTEIKTIHLELNTLKNVDYQVFYTDATSSSLKDLPKKKYIGTSEKSKYIPCYLSGESKLIGIKVFSELAEVEKVTINEKIPFEFNLARVIVLFGIITFVYLLKTLECYKIPYSIKNFEQELTLIFVLCVFVLITCLINQYSINPKEIEDFYSVDFVHALSKGQVHLEREPSDKFKSLENPYDGGERTRAGLKRGSDYLWDVAYFEGKYYVYFGILPAILMLPYHLITGNYIGTPAVVLIFSLLTAISFKSLIKHIFKRYFSEVPFKFMVFSLIILLFGSQILWVNGIPRFYELSIISALFFAVTGINFVFCVLENEDKKYRYMFLASLFLSLSVACRPTQLLTSLVFLPILIMIFIKNVKEKKDIVKNILAVAIPYLSIGIALMYYNYIRFGSIFEFGAGYQLTINDMKNLGNRPMTVGMGIVCSLFSIPHFLPNFPFMIYHNNLLTFYGYYYIENVMGGLFAMVPICLFIFGIYKMWKRTDNKRLLYFTTTVMIVRITYMYN